MKAYTDMEYDDTKIWHQILEDYHIAKHCFYDCHHEQGWRRDEETGLFHLWRAYHAATMAKEKQNLLFARVLMMMSRENHCVCNYTKFHRYVSPAMEAYKLALADENQPTQEELDYAQRCFDRLVYELDATSNSSEQYERAYLLIEGLNQIPDFQFHDSKPVRFEHSNTEATLELCWSETTVQIQFKGVFEIYVSCDPLCNFVNDFYCYRDFDRPHLLIFDICEYRILCEKIIATKIAP